MRRSPYRDETPPGWNPSSEPPPPGSVVEIQNNFGIAPWYGLYEYTKDRTWKDVRDPTISCWEGPHLSWRWPTTTENGSPDTYVDPTVEAQNEASYWMQATGIAPDYGKREIRAALRPNPTNSHPGTDNGPIDTPKSRTFFQKLVDAIYGIRR